MSKRVGLRSLSLALGKPKIICPKGEQIVNGGFETGDLTGWNVVGRHITRPFYDWRGTRGSAEVSSEWKLHGRFSMKTSSQGEAASAYNSLSLNPFYVSVFGFLLAAGDFSTTRSNIIYNRSSAAFENAGGFAIKRVNGVDYFFFVWRTTAGEFEENTGVVVNRNQVYWLQVGIKLCTAYFDWRTGRYVQLPDGYARGWINGVLVADKSNIINRLYDWDTLLGPEVGVNCPISGGGTNVVAFFDDVVVNTDYISSNPFETGEQYYWQSSFEGYYEDIGPAWEKVTADVWEDLPIEGIYMARIMPYESDFIGDIGCPRISGQLEQYLAKPVPCKCITEDSVFSVATKVNMDYCAPTMPEEWSIEILYTDGTKTVLDISGDPANAWIIHDLRDILEPDKVIKGIRIKATVDRCGGVGIQWTECLVDLCSLVPEGRLPKVTFRIPPITYPVIEECRCKGYWMVEEKKVHDGEVLELEPGTYHAYAVLPSEEDPQYDPEHPCYLDFIYDFRDAGNISYNEYEYILVVEGDGRVHAVIGCFY